MLETENPFVSLRSAIAFSSKDFSIEKTDAWIFAVVMGWGDPAMAELAVMHNWSPETVARLRRLHAAFVEAEKLVPRTGIEPARPSL